jgi:outer membrane protein assembly factor BamB
MTKMALFLAATFAAAGADWPQWRGLKRDGTSAETGLMRAWPQDGPKRDWMVEGLGEGYSTVSVSNGVIFTQGQRGATQYVMAFDAATGKKLWEVANGGAFNERRGDGPRGVPTVEGDRLWAYSADGTLSCLDTKSGKRVWSYNAVQKYGGSVPNWGISESPLVDGEHLIVVTGGRGASVVALNKRTGEPVWRSQSDPAAYSSAILAEVGAVRQVLTFTANGAMGLRADNGELLWRYDQVANRTANIATPIFHNGHAFFSSDYGTGCALLRLQPQGGSVRSTEVYFNREMRNHYSSSVLVGDHLYGFSSAILTAMKFLTGEVAWRDRSVGKGSVIYAEGHLYALGEDGTVGLVEATPAVYREKSRFTIAKGSLPMWAPPVIANGRLYLRDQDRLFRYDIRAAR